MALPTVALIEAAVTNIFTALQDAKDREPLAYPALQSLWETVVPTLRKLYSPVLEVALTDATDAGVAEALAVDGELGLAWQAAYPKNLTFPVGALFSPGVTNDFTDNALATAKGSGVAAADIYQVTGADAVKYLGAAQPDFTDDQPADF